MEIIIQTLPEGPGQRNRQLFDLARRLKAVRPEASTEELRKIVLEWHRQAFPLTSRAHTAEESWQDFEIAWKNVKYPLGATLYGACAAAEAVKLEGLAATYESHLRRLAQLCVALQAQRGAAPFPLSCRKAREHLHTSAVHANKLFKTLESDGFLKLVKKGTKKSRKASEWRVVGMKRLPTTERAKLRLSAPIASALASSQPEGRPRRLDHKQGTVALERSARDASLLRAFAETSVSLLK
jgi:hypothetical protein